MEPRAASLLQLSIAVCYPPPVTTGAWADTIFCATCVGLSGCSSVHLWVYLSVGLWVCHAKWSNLLQVKTEVFLSGPSIAPLHFDLESSEVKDVKMLQWFFDRKSVANSSIYLIKDQSKSSPMLPLLPRCILKIERSKFKSRMPKFRNRCLAVTLPPMARFTSSRPTDHNVLISGAGLLAMHRTADFIVVTRY